MDEKRPATIEDPDLEITNIERTFTRIVSEIEGLPKLSSFQETFVALHQNLLDTHAKNQKLANYCQELNKQIIFNATRVSSLIKMSEDDRRCINRYKDEFEKAWNLVRAAQDKEIQAQSICENLRTQIDNLSSIVQMKASSENQLEDLKLDITNFKTEYEQRLKEIDLLSKEISNMKAAVSSTSGSLEASKKKAANIDGEISSETSALLKIQQSLTEYYNEIDNVTKEINETSKSIEKNSEDFESMKKRIEGSSEERYQQLSVLKDYEKEETESKRKLEVTMSRLQKAQRETILTEKKIAIRKEKLNEMESEAQTLIEQSGSFDQLLSLHQAEFDLISKRSSDLAQEIERQCALRTQRTSDMVRLGFSNVASESQSKALKRESNFQLRKVEQVRRDLNDANEERSEMEDLVIVNSRAVESEKGIVEERNKSIYDADSEVRNFSKLSSDINVQIIKFEDRIFIAKAQIDTENTRLAKLKTCSKEQEDLIKKIKAERDLTSNQIGKIESDNDILQKNVSEVKEELQILKNRIQEETVACIKEHFQSRGAEKQIKALEDVIVLTKKMEDEAEQAIFGYKTEQTKLCIVLDEAQKDTMRIQLESKQIADSQNFLKGQIVEREVETSKAEEIVKNRECELKMRAEQYYSLRKNNSALLDQMMIGVNKNQILLRRSSMAAAIKSEVIYLDTRLQYQKELQNKFEIELERPINVHRWMFMKEMQPDLFKKIQMITYLKGRIEGAKRDYQRKSDQKERLKREMTKIEDRLKNCSISDGKGAINECKEVLRRKEEEIASMEEESKKLKEDEDTCERKVKKSREKVVEVRQKTEKLKVKMPKVPKLDLGTDNLLRVGGGFCGAPPKTERMVVEPEEEKHIKREAPKTSRPMSAAVLRDRQNNKQPRDNVTEMAVCGISCRRPETGIARISLRKKKESGQDEESYRPNSSRREMGELPFSARPQSARRMKRE